MENMDEKTTPANDDVINYKGVKAMPFIVGNEAFEKLGTIGTLSNLLVYLSTVFNMKNITATTFINVFNGTSNVAPLLGAFLSDSYFGRYLTLAFASISSLLGMTILTLTAAIPTLHPPSCANIHTSPPCNNPPTPWQMTVLLIGFGFLVIGAGGIRPCNLAFGADQFNPATESGRKGINSFFNWYYFTFTFAMMISVTFIVYIQSNISWAIGLGIPACLMLMSCGLFFLGSKLFVKVRPEKDRSPIISVVQVLVAATRKRRLKLPDNPSLSLFNYVPPKSLYPKLPHTHQFRFLDKAAIITSEDEISPDGSAAKPWKLCRMQQVEEAKCVLRVTPIWASAILYFVAILQQYTYAILQALQSDRRLGKTNFQVPAASFVVFYMLSLTLWIPFYDKILVPFLRKLSGKEGGLTLLQRMGTGLVLSVITMVVSGFVEGRRRHLSLTRPTLGAAAKGGEVSSMSAFWLVPQLTLAGVTEAFNSIGQIEFYYKEFPENMRSVAGSLLFLGLSGSSYLSGFLISVVHQVTERSGVDWLAEDLNEGRLDYFYYMIAALGVLNFGYFLVFASWYRYKRSDESFCEVSMVVTKQPC